MKAKLIQLLDALHPLVQVAVKWLQCNVDFAFILAAFTETPRWTVAFRAIHESAWIGVPLGVLLAFSTAKAWRRYFEQPDNLWLLSFNVASVAIAVAVISPVLYALTKTETVDLAQVLQPWALGVWACLLAVSTFSPLVQLAAVTDAPALQSCKPRTKTVHHPAPALQDDAPSLAERARMLKSEGLSNVQIGKEIGVNRNRVAELLK